MRDVAVLTAVFDISLMFYILGRRCVGPVPGDRRTDAARPEARTRRQLRGDRAHPGGQKRRLLPVVGARRCRRRPLPQVTSSIVY